MLEALSPLLLACGYFLNGGVGQFMQPNASGTTTPPPPAATILVTQGGAQLVTQSGLKIVTH